MIYLREKCILELATWKKSDIKTYQKIQKLISTIETSPLSGIGKPEPLKHALSGLWSRRIDRKNRIVYAIEGNDIFIISCKGHYEQ